MLLIVDKQPNERSQRSEKVGEISRIFKRGKQWHVTLQFANRQKRLSLHTESKKQAISEALRIEREFLTGKRQDTERSIKLVEAIDLFMANKRALDRAKRTLEKYEYCFKLMKQLATQRRVTKLSQIDIGFMDAYQSMRMELAPEDGNPAKTIKNDLVQIRGLVNFALRRKLLREDPLAGFSFEKSRFKVQPYWNAEELRRIVEAADRKPHGDVFKLLAETGMRVGEAKQLTWNDVDFANNLIQIRAKQGWRSKSGDDRLIPITAEMSKVLAAQPKQLDWVFTFPAMGRWPVRQVSERRLLDYVKRLLKRLGLKGHVHTFRHTHVTLALKAGTPQAVLRAYIGHIDQQTLNHYTHIAGTDARAAIENLAKVVSNQKPSS